MKAKKPITYDATGKPLVNISSTRPLREAIEQDDLDTVRSLLRAGNGIERLHSQEKTFLEVAAERGNLEIVRELIAADMDLNRGFEYSPLYTAVLQGHFDVVRELISAGADVDLRVDEDDDTALLEAIEQGNLEMVKLFVEAGANVNLWGEVGTPLLVALESGHKNIYDFLYPLVTNQEILRTADENFHQLQTISQSELRSSQEAIEVLVRSAAEGNLEKLQSVLRPKIDVNGRNSEGSTALIEAAYFGHISIIKILLSRGANPNLFSKTEDGLQGRTPLMAAASSDSNNRLRVIKMLIRAAADVNLKGASDFTALMYALFYGSFEDREEIVKALVCAGADVNAIDASGTSILMHARANGLEKIVSLLQLSGAWR